MLLLVAAALAQDAAHGAALAEAAQCASCHTAPGGKPYAGGYAVETKFGTFYGPNLTSDTQAGLGRWTGDDFEDALRRGRDDRHRKLWPAFPWPSFTRLSDADIADLWAYFQTIPPDPSVSPKDRVHFPLFRGLLGVWTLFAVDRGPFADDPTLDATWERGRYLGEAVAHCEECHTPRSGLGAIRHRRALAGNDQPPAPSPDITTLGWSVGEWDSFLSDGITPDGDLAAREMRRVIREGTSKLTDEDRLALATWAESIPESKPRWRRRDEADPEDD